MIERDNERDLCAAALTRLRAGTGGVLAVAGGLGAGKTALLRQAADLARCGGVPVVTAAANRVEQDLPRSLASRLWREVRCSAAARAGMLLVTIDDLQWADDASLAWLTRLAGRAGRLPAGVPALVMVAVLDGDPAGDRSGVRAALARADRTLRPHRLSAAGVERLAAAAAADLARNPAPDPARKALGVAHFHRLTGGNPLLVHAIAQDTAGWPAADGLPDVTGPGYAPLRQRVVTAIAALPAPVRAYLLQGVLLGADAEPELVGRLAGLDATDARTAHRVLRAMELHGAPEPMPLLDAVVRHVVGTTICPESFAVGHAHAAELLYQLGAPAERIAAHLEQVVTLPPYAAGVLADAAGTALARHDVAAAVRYLQVTLRSLPSAGAERARVLVDLAVAERCAEPSTALRRVLQALPSLPGDGERAAALARIPPVALLADADAAGEAIDGVLQRLPVPDEPARALAQRLEARLWMAGWQDQAVLAGATARLRDGLMQPRTAAERELAAALLFCATMSAGVTAQELAPLAQLLLESLPAEHDALAAFAPLVVIGAVAIEGVPALHPWLAEALLATDAGPCPPAAARVHAQLAFLRLHTGHPGPAAISAANAFTVLPDGFGDDRLSTAMLVAVAAAVPDDRLRRRAAALCRPERATAETGLLPMVGNLLHGVSLSGRDPGAALAALSECEQQLATHGWRNRALFPTGTLLAPLLHRLGRPEEALACIAEEHRLVAAWGAPAATGRTLRIWGELSRGRQSLRLLDDAVEVLERAGNELELAHALLARGTRLLAIGRRGAGEDLRRGERLAAAAGFSWLMKPVNVALEAHQEQLVPGISTFTPAERTVAELVMSGLTNQAVAGHLGVSQRAVEKHLTSCYRKLGVTDRTGLKAVLRQVAAKMSDVHFG